jgi:hypothetical protein
VQYLIQGASIVVRHLCFIQDAKDTVVNLVKIEDTFNPVNGNLYHEGTMHEIIYIRLTPPVTKYQSITIFE